MGKGQYQSQRADVLHWPNPGRREIRNEAEARRDLHQQISKLTRCYLLSQLPYGRLRTVPFIYQLVTSGERCVTRHTPTYFLLMFAAIAALTPTSPAQS